ncbi:MAG: hypothetical protein KF916_06220 [Microbacteriaceae bacterium]|nr:hypothetical protein [Microbacteriaceae bacterium]
MNTPEFDLRLKIAMVADKYANLISTVRGDQLYLTIGKQNHFITWFQMRILSNPPKVHKLGDRILIVHAPSSPIIKGTPLVRAAIRRLKDEHYDIDYFELIGVSNSEVKEKLSRAHIAISNLYATVPGVLGVEAMAAGCALVTSADENEEPDLPSGSNQAWYVTKDYEVYDHLKDLIENPKKITQFSDNGLKWLRKYGTASVSGKRIRAWLSSIDEQCNLVLVTSSNYLW